LGASEVEVEVRGKGTGEGVGEGGEVERDLLDLKEGKAGVDP